MKLFGLQVPFTKLSVPTSPTTEVANRPKSYLAPSQAPGGAIKTFDAGPEGNLMGQVNEPNHAEGSPVNRGRKAVYDGPAMGENIVGGPDYPFDQYETVFDQVIAGDLNLPDMQQQILERKLDLWAGIEFPYINPDPTLRAKHRNLLFYDSMLMDDRIKSVTELKKRMILSVPYNITPASESEEDIAIAEDVKTQLHGLTLGQVQTPLKDIFDNFLDAHYYGFKIAEKVWKYNEKTGRIWLQSIKHRHSIFFDPVYDNYKNVRGVWIGRYYGGHKQVLGKAFSQKFMLFVHPYMKDGNAYGNSDLSEIFPQFRAKQKIFNYRNERLEGWGKPIPIATYDGVSMDSGEISDLDAQLSKFQNKKFFMIPAVRNKQTGKLEGKVEITFQEARVGSSGQSDAYNAAIEQIDTQISRKLLVPDKLGVTSSDGGSYALGKTQFDLFLAVVEREHDKLENLFKPLIKQMVDYNYNVKAYPRLEFDKITNRMESQLLKILIDERVVDPREHWIRSHSGIPELSKKEKEELAAAPAPVPLEVKGGPIEPPAGAPAPARPQASIQPAHAHLKAKRTPPVNFKDIHAHLVSTEDEFLAIYAGIFKAKKEFILRQIKNKKIIENKDLEAARALNISTTDVRDLIQSCLAKLYIFGKSDVIKELKPRLKALDHKVEFKMTVTDLVKFASLEAEKDWLDRDYIKKFMSQHDEWGTISKADAEYLAQIKQIAAQGAEDIDARLTKSIFGKLTEGFRAELGPDAILSGIVAVIDQEEDRYKTTTFRTVTSTAYNEGRAGMFDSPVLAPLIEAFEYSAIMDDVTTPFCEEHNGQILSKNDPRLASITPPNHFNALAEGSMIRTDRGEVPVEQVRIGDRALTHKGNWRNVYATMSKESDSRVRELRLDSGEVIRATDEHPILTLGGWKATQDLKAGDMLFKNVQNVAGVSGVGSAHPENFPSLFAEESIPYEVVRVPLAVGVVLFVNFKNNTFHAESEISNVSVDGKLEIVSSTEAAQVEKVLKGQLAHRGVLSHDRGMVRGSLGEGHRIVGRVSGLHALGVGGVKGACFLAKPEGPMVRTSLMPSGVGVGDRDLFNAGSDLDSVPLAPGGKNGLPDPHRSLNGSNALVPFKVTLDDDRRDSGLVSKIHDGLLWVTSAIITIADTEYKGRVFNLGVEEDESYCAEGFAVHNCRSILIPVFVGDDELDGGSYQGYKDEMEKWGTGVSKENEWPAEGFGKPTGA